ncbi:BTB/POZ domain-containing protein [Actinidia rufa]|uniref:BTB/POZ domain-containing protein n=1 Tax=Actinidia rufa TaxID=165716 RepID=A0A7J0DA83_9ERIC|nr:BTB/POZ domain-containing protein [Actinidia rufa]
MGTTTPVEVGTRGTVASLVMKEIEYFRGLPRPREHMVAAMGGSSRSNSNSWLSFGFVGMTWRRKKRRGGGGLLPRMCSAVEVDDMNGISGFSYRNLKADVKKYEL